MILSHYFRQYKGLAMGINYCGSTVAGMIFPKFMEFLYKEFGLRGEYEILRSFRLPDSSCSRVDEGPSRRDQEARISPEARQRTFLRIPGLFLIYAGMMLNTPVISYLMHKPSWTRKNTCAPDIGKRSITKMPITSVRDFLALSNQQEIFETAVSQHLRTPTAAS